MLTRLSLRDRLYFRGHLDGGAVLNCRAPYLIRTLAASPAMWRSCLIVILISSLLCVQPVVITSPKAGEALQGQVMVTGTSSMDGFQSAEVAFSYADNPTGTWFLIQSSDQAVTEGELAAWDTTALTDGNYTLRLLVTLQDGSQVQTTVTGLRVRNYTPVETETPTRVPPTLQPTLTATAVMTDTPYPTPTPLPPNPAALTVSNIYTSLGIGALTIALLFVLFGLLLWLRRR
jgi:hypothetical protein